MHTTVPAKDGRFAGCCPVPAPERGSPHVAHWAGTEAGTFLSLKLGPEEAIRLGTALLAAGRAVAPKELDHRIGELPLGAPEPDDDED
jgi:hypothetical protein